MKVYILTKEPFPNGMAATNRIKCYARAIIAGGVDCEVVVCGCTELKKDSIRNTVPLGFYEEVPFRYIGGYTVDTRPTTIRLFSQYFRLIQTAFYLRRHLENGDVVIFYLDANIQWYKRFIRLSHRKGAFCVRDLCEYPLGARSDSEDIVKQRERVFNDLFPKFDGIISISDALLDVAKRHSSQCCKHLKVPIMVEYERYYTDDKSKECSVPYIFHAGSLSQQKDGVLGMIEAFGLAKQSLNYPLKYYLTGTIASATCSKEIEDLLDKYQLHGSVCFLGYLFPEEVKEYLSRASLVISNRPKSRQDYYGFSTKVGEYLATGTPLITTKWGEVVNWLEDGKSAYILPPEDTIALANSIIHVFSDPDDAAKVGRNGQKVCKDRFDYCQWSKSLVNYFKSFSQS